MFSKAIFVFLFASSYITSAAHAQFFGCYAGRVGGGGSNGGGSGTASGGGRLCPST